MNDPFTCVRTLGRYLPSRLVVLLVWATLCHPASATEVVWTQNQKPAVNDADREFTMGTNRFVYDLLP